MARPEDQNEEGKDENLDNSDDSFGLPEIDYEPLKREEPFDDVKEEPFSSNESAFTSPEPPLDIPAPPIQEVRKEEFGEDNNSYYEPSSAYSYEEERPSIWPKILGVVVLLALAGVGIWYFYSYKPKQDAIEARRARDKAATEEAAEQRRLAEEAERLKAEEASKTATPVKEDLPAGTIQTLSGRTGKYYVVITSAIDGDLIMDYAKKLSKKGVTSKIIPPYGKVKFHRLTVAEGDTYANAQATADGMKGGDYGNQLWVIHY